ncbi:MAG TPA: efflux transporter outer membrane subunit [Caldimonas sp.]|nr:efflux transporter outer membrane subunit [Caldimonas sp.]HEX4235359.1 efflux transporter outer membrane subunit [Caldimonas sp.]
MLRRGSALALAAAMTGCALQPVYRRPDVPVAASFPNGLAYPPTAPGAPTLPAAEIGWRDVLTDPRLQRLIEIALANNRDLRVAALHVEQVAAQYRIQRAALSPQVGGFADASASRVPAGVSGSHSGAVSRSYAAGLEASWEIDFFGRLRSLNEQALQQYLATAQAQKAFEILLVSQVADQYLSVLAYDEFLAVTQRTLGTAQDSYQITLLQFKTGTGTELALRQAETVVEQAKANHFAQLRGRAQAENALVLLLGQPLPTDLPPAVPLASQAILADIPAGLPSDLLTRRPDIMQAEATLRAANADIGVARAAFFPTISLTGNLGTASAALAGLFGAGSLAWSFVPSLTLPLFLGGRLQADLDVATVQKDIDVAQYEKTVQTAFREVADGLAARGTYGDELASLEQDVAAQQRALDLSQLQFKTGTTSYLTVLTAQTGLYSAQLGAASTRLASLTSVVDLYRALGGGWIEHTGDTTRFAEAIGWQPRATAEDPAINPTSLAQAFAPVAARDPGPNTHRRGDSQ